MTRQTLEARYAASARRITRRTLELQEAIASGDAARIAEAQHRLEVAEANCPMWAQVKYGAGLVPPTP